MEVVEASAIASMGYVTEAAVKRPPRRPRK